MTAADSVPAVGQIVAITTTDSQPWILVVAVDEATDRVTGIILADLADETIHRLRGTTEDQRQRRQLATAVARADPLPTFEVPLEDTAPRTVDKPGEGE